MTNVLIGALLTSESDSSGGADGEWNSRTVLSLGSFKRLRGEQELTSGLHPHNVSGYNSRLQALKAPCSATRHHCLSGVSAYETELADLGREDFWLIVALEGSEDETEVRAGESWLKRRTADLCYRLLRTLANIDIPPDTKDFRLMNRRSIDMLNATPEGARYLRGMIAWVGLDQRPIFYDRKAGSAGTTKYSMWRMIGLVLEGITSFSIYQLRIASLPGLLMSASAVPVFAYALCSWLLSGAQSIFIGRLVRSGEEIYWLSGSSETGDGLEIYDRS